MPMTSLRSPIADVSKIRCLAFDAVGTLIFAEPSVASAYASIGQQFGSQVTADEIGSRFREAMRQADTEAERWFGELGRTNEDYEREFWRRIVREVLPDVGDAETCFETLFDHFARPASWQCFEDVGSTLTQLQARGYRVVIASNFDARLQGVCDGLSELRDVRTRVISSAVGYRKTHPRFYAAVVEAAECDASEVLMIGDDFENDVVSARNAGIAAVHLQRELPNVGDTRQPIGEPVGVSPRTGGQPNQVQGLTPSGSPKTSDGTGNVPAIVETLSDLLEWLP